MRATGQTYRTLGWRTKNFNSSVPVETRSGHENPIPIGLTAQADAANVTRINNPAMTETRRPEIHPRLRRTDQKPPARRIRQEPHHQILQQPLRMLELHEDPFRRIRRLLQEHRIARYLRDIDRYRHALAREDGVHHRDILMRQVAAHGENQDAGCQQYGCVFDT